MGEVADNGGDEIWKMGNRLAALMGDMRSTFDGMPLARMVAKVNVDNIFGEGGYVEYVSVPKAIVSKSVTFLSDFGWPDSGAILETFVTCI